MNQTKIVRQNLISLILGVAGFVAMLGIVLFVLLSPGVIGWIEYEYLGLLAFLLLLVIPIVSLLFGVISLRKGNKTRLAAKVAGSFSLVAAISFATFFSITGNISLPSPDLDIYSSKDGRLREDNNLKIAVASDSHWGSKKSNKEARNQIMDTIFAGSYDLMVHGGDVVDLGFVKSYYQEAISDMQAHMPTQKVHFVMGNHDALVNGENNFRRVFQPGEDSPSHVLDLSPNVHWVIFNMIWDEIEVRDSDIRWLEETLSQYPKDDCLVVESHGFYYATGDKSGYGEWYDREKTISRICSVFERYNVDLVVSGHVHSMEFMRSGGVSYALVGPFGGSLFPSDKVKTNAESLFLNGTDYGFTEFDIKDDGSIGVTYRNQNGSPLFCESVAYK